MGPSQESSSVWGEGSRWERGGQGLFREAPGEQGQVLVHSGGEGKGVTRLAP